MKLAHKWFGVVALIFVITQGIHTTEEIEAATATTKTTTMSASSVQVTVGSTKKIKLTGLKSGDITKVYTGNKTGTSVSCTVSSGTSCEITSGLSAVILDKGGMVYVTNKASGKTESDALKVSYLTSYSTDLSKSNLSSSTNNASGYSDLISLTGLKSGDKITVYASNEASAKKLASGTVSTGTTLTVSGSMTTQSTANVFLSIAQSGKVESAKRLAVKFTSDQSVAPVTSNITATNNLDHVSGYNTLSSSVDNLITGTADVVEVKGLLAGDVVKLYDKVTGGTALATATVADGATSTRLSGVGILSDTAKMAFITVQSSKKSASKMVKVSYSATLSKPVNAKYMYITDSDADAKIDVVYGFHLSPKAKIVLATLGNPNVTNSTGKMVPFGVAQVGEFSKAFDFTFVDANSNMVMSTSADLYIAQLESGKLLSKYTKVTYSSE